MRSTLASLRQRYAEWSPAEDEPPVTAEADARLLEAHCAPADPRWLAIELKRTVDALRPAPKGIDEGAASDAMMEALEDAPVDIAQAALKRVRMECKWFPKAAEIRDRVVAELGERKRAAIKARVAADMAARRKPAPPHRPATEAEKARVSAMAAPVYARARDNPLKGPPEPRQGGPDISAAIRAVAAETAGRRLPDVDDPDVRKWLGVA
ncbi:MAG: hypothetical protein IPK85_01770 [Gemmatimonadetes bacterium]|nr:hypothetical protein [Gemmatimonadota bacterium]